MPSQQRAVKRVMSLDGGGIRGIIPALVIAHLERQMSAPASELFDLIVGTKHDLKTPDNKNISLTIPPGTTPNTVFSVAGHGIPDISTNKRGNFFVEVKCKIPKYDKHTIEKIKQFRAKNI